MAVDARTGETSRGDTVKHGVIGTPFTQREEKGGGFARCTAGLFRKSGVVDVVGERFPPCTKA